MLTPAELCIYRQLGDPREDESPLEYVARHREMFSLADVSNIELTQVCNWKRQVAYSDRLVARIRANDADSLAALSEAVVLLLRTHYMA